MEPLDLHSKGIELFGSNWINICDSIKQVMLNHNLDYRDKNLQDAFFKVAIGIKKNYNTSTNPQN